MTLRLDHLIAMPDGYGVTRIWDNRDPDAPQPLDEGQLTDLMANVLFWHSVPDVIGEPA
jgi:hypothetical protein